LAVLAILQPDARAEARLTEALGGAHDLIAGSGWADIEGILQQHRVDACLVDADHPDRDSASAWIGGIRERFPDVAIIARVEGDRAEGYFELGTLGVDGVVVGDANASRIRADVDLALSSARAKLVGRRLHVHMSEPGPSALAWAVEHAGPDATVERLAAGLGVTPAALRERLQELGLPSPARLLLWGRLLLAAARLGEDGRRLEDVAFSLGYSTSTALARAMKLHTGFTPAEVSRPGGMPTVLEALLTRTASTRGNGRGLRPTAMARLATFTGMLVLTGCATLGLSGGGVDRDAIDRVIDTPPIDQLHVGVYAVDATSGRTLYRRNEHRKFVPASNQKILVTATALSLLGPDYRFRTELVADGPVRGSYLDGDLVLVASGDPSMSARYWTSGTAALEALADSLRASGVTYVAGSGIVDVSAWDSTTVGPTWEVEDLRYAYGSTGGAFAIDEGEVRVVVEGGPAADAPVAVTWTPMGHPDFVESRLSTAPSDSVTRIVPQYLPETRRLVLEGRVELGTVDTLSFALRDPVRQAVAALATAVDRTGVEVEGGWTIRWTPDDRGAAPCSEAGLGGSCTRPAPLAALESPPLSELVAGILEPSQNWMTEQLVRALGARYGEQGSWREGVGVVRAHLVNEVGVDSLDIASRDGSGLSAYNLVTPRALVGILREMYLGPHAAAYRSAMAEPGEEDSTLERRLEGLEGRVFAKTGSISNVNSLSGYLVRDNGQEVIFSILTNASGLPASQVRQAIDEIVRGLAR
jgi:D-alanyl-D-alanine carboxypeptidase/D-alanyl-D-alanine-endopeptidase (penicillin-binding protein 4)